MLLGIHSGPPCPMCMWNAGFLVSYVWMWGLKDNTWHLPNASRPKISQCLMKGLYFNTEKDGDRLRVRFVHKDRVDQHIYTPRISQERVTCLRDWCLGRRSDSSSVKGTLSLNSRNEQFILTQALDPPRDKEANDSSFSISCGAPLP